MNVLYLNTHDIGRCLQPYGYPVQTPNLYKLSREGLTFGNMYCASPTCSPSRGALLTGQYPHSNGLIGLSHRGFCIKKDRHLASYLRGQGYETVHSGVQHEIRLHQEEDLGYDKCLNPPQYYRGDMPQCDLYTWQDELAAENAARYLKDRRPGDPPFYLAIGFGCTHREYPRVPEGYETNSVMVPKALPDLPETRQDMAGMMVAVNTVDRLCGQVLSALMECGEYHNTLILFTTDHGLPFPMMKCSLYDDGLGVALLMRYPGMNRGKGRIDALLSQVDVFPTICDIIGTKAPDWLQGHSFLPVINGEREEIRTALFAEINYHVAYEPVRCMRTKQYKYIVRGDNGYEKAPPVHVDDSLSKEVFSRYGYFERTLVRQELYDLMLDPQERDNLAYKPEYEEVRQECKSRLTHWGEETEDPFWKGGVSLPEGAICCTADSYSTKTQVILPECRNYVDGLRGILQNSIDT